MEAKYFLGDCLQLYQEIETTAAAAGYRIDLFIGRKSKWGAYLRILVLCNNSIPKQISVINDAYKGMPRVQYWCNGMPAKIKQNNAYKQLECFKRQIDEFLCEPS